MKNISKNNSYNFFSAFGIFFLGLNLISILLAMMGIFHITIIIVYIFAGIFLFFYLIKKRTLSMESSKSFLLISFISIAFVIFLSFFSTPTIFSGRDQGSFSEAAIRLSQNHKLGFSSAASEEFFKIHGKGLAQNFPGFNYDSKGNLVPHFSIGYIAWLAVFFSLFGLKGLFIANAVSFIVFIFSFYIMARIFFRKSAPVIISTILILTSFIFSWFLKFTLAENLALGFLWFSIAQATIFFKNRNRENLFYALLSLIILAFSRLEAWSFVLMLLILILIIIKKEKAKATLFFNKKTIYILLIIFLIYLINIYVNSPFYIASIKGLLKSFSLGSEQVENSVGIFHAMRVMSIYALFAPFLIAITGSIYLLAKKKVASLIPFFIILPSLIYILHPGISPDHPWMLRRFLFSLIPASIFISTYFLYSFFRKKIYFYFLISVISISNLFIFFHYLTYSENRELLLQTKNLSRNFSSSDLILVDRLTSGNGWSMITGPMNFIFKKQAVYFFDPKDLDKINHKRFTNTYFIIPDENIDFYLQNNIIEKLVPIKDYSMINSSLSIPDQPSKTSLNLPQKEERFVRGKIYMLKK